MAQRSEQGKRRTKPAPLFSVITVVEGDSPPLRKSLRSVLDQTLQDWEHIVVQVGNVQPKVRKALAQATSDPRVTVVQGDAETRSAGLNLAAASASGRWLALLAPGDRLVPTALATMAGALPRKRNPVLAYSDWCEIDQKGKAGRTFLKPDWSPERLRGNEYVTDLTVLHRAAVRRIGGWRDTHTGADDLDLLLRLTEGGADVVHVAEVLYHRRQRPPGPAASEESDDAAVACVQDHCDRLGLQAVVQGTGHAGYLRLARTPRGAHSVSVVIPTRGTAAEVFGKHRVMVVEAVRSMIESSPSWPFEVIVVADEPTDAAYLDELHEMLGPRLRVIPYQKAFNFSEKVNLGAFHATGDVIVFANDDLQIITPHWLEQLTAILEEEDVGLVGALLRFEDGSVQHCGHVYRNRVAFHAHFGIDTRTGYFGDALIDHEASGATAALVACRRDVWRDVGGFSLKFPGSFNDVDFCLKIRWLGYRIVVACAVESWHFESKTRDPTVHKWEIDLMQARWSARMREERYMRGEGMLSQF